MSSKLLQGKTVLVTGASRGIGAEISCALAREGAKLILVGSPGSQDELHQCAEKCKGEGVTHCECKTVDLANPEEVNKLCLECDNVDVLINNAGIFGPSAEEQGPLKGNPDEWDKLLKINAMAPMRMIRAFAPKMSSKGEGAIISIGDVEAFHTGPSHPAYAASKFALRGFTLSAYEALRDSGVKVCNIAAGNVSGTGMASGTGKHGGQGALDPADVVESLLLVFRLSKNAVPEEIVVKAVKPGRA